MAKKKSYDSLYGDEQYIKKARKKNQKAKKSKKTLGKFLLNIFIILLILAGIFAYLLFNKGFEMYQRAITSCSISEKIFLIKNTDDYLDSTSIGDNIKNSIVAIEDHRFYSHHGIDLIATVRASISNLNSNSLKYGASTITQQLARIMYFSQEKSFIRKIAELFVAFDLEKSLSKSDILTLYLNSIYYGDGYTGIKKASIRIFW